MKPQMHQLQVYATVDEDNHRQARLWLGLSALICEAVTDPRYRDIKAMITYGPDEVTVR